MTRKSRRELWRTLEGFEPPVEVDISCEVIVVMDRETAEAEGWEIVGEVGDKTRVATVFNPEGEVVGGGPETRVRDGVDLVEVTPFE